MELLSPAVATLIGLAVLAEIVDPVAAVGAVLAPHANDVATAEGFEQIVRDLLAMRS